MKRLLLKYSLVLIIVFNFSCDNDEPTVEQHTEEFAKTDLIDFSKLQSEDISFDQLLTKLNNPTLDKGILSKIDFGINSNDNITNRVVDTLLIVDTNTLFFAQYDNYNYTTFPIIEDLDNDSFRNLIIENIDGDHPVARIITYTPDETWLYSDHTLIEYAGEATMESFSGEWQVSTQRSQYCHITTTTNWGCDYQWNSGHYPGYPGCYGGNVITGYTTTEDCYDFTGGEGSGSGSGGGDGEGSGGSGNGSSDGDDLPIITKPVERCLQSDVDPAICECMADGSTMQECLEEDDCTVSLEDFNSYYSELSPFNVDLSSVREGCDDTIDLSQVEANAKFMCLYNKLVESPKFKTLFFDTFGESTSLNIQFKTVPSIDGANGKTRLQPNTENNYNPNTGEVNLNLLIEIDESYMSSFSAIAVTKTILHECIHAYLILKHIQCNAGTPFDEIIDDINDKKLGELLNHYYETSCENEEQHEFMYDNMIPVMSLILSDLKDQLIPENHQNAAESDTSFINEDNPSGETIAWSWNEFYKYLSSSGLHQTDAFQWEIPQGSPQHTNYIKYSINYGKNLFRKDCND